MSESWPATVPYFALVHTVQGEAPFRKPYRTTFEDGNKRARRSTTKNTATVAFSLVPFTKDQFKTFAQWVRDDLVDGTLPFTMKVWTGSDYEERTCSFVEDYTWSDIGYQMMQVQVKLDIDDYIGPA